MTFLRQLYKQKPQAWGPVSAVQASIFKNAESIGIAPENILLAIPAWEKSTSILTNYGLLSGPTSSGTTEIYNDGIRLNTDGKLTIPYNSLITKNTASVSIFGVIENLNNSTDSAALNIINGLFGKGIYSYALLSNSHFKRPTIRIFGVTTDTTASTVNSPINTDINFIFKWSLGKAEILAKANNYYTYVVETGYTDVTPTTGESELIIGGTGDFVLKSLFLIGGEAPLSVTDNPYFFMHRVPPVFYSVPGGGVLPTFNPLFLNAAQPTRVIQ